MKEFKIGPVLYSGDTVSCTYEGNGDTKTIFVKYPFQIPRTRVTEGIFRMLFNVPRSYYESYVDKVTSETPPTAISYSLIQDIQFNDIMTARSLGVDIEIPERVVFPEKKNYDINPDDGFLVGLSGGNESTLSYRILELLGYRPGSMTIKERETYPSKKLQKKLEIPLIETNFEEIFSIGDIIPEQINNLKINSFITLIILAEAVYALETGSKNIIIGDEIDCNKTLTSPEGIEYLGRNYDQSNSLKRKFTKYFQHIGANIQVFSILEGLYTTGIVKRLNNTCEDLFPYITSCFSPTEDTHDPCNACLKCRRIAGIIWGLGYEKMGRGMGYNYLEILENTELMDLSMEGVFSSQDCKEEAEHINFLLRSRNYPLLAEVDCIEHPHIEEVNNEPWQIQFPFDIYNFLKNGHTTESTDIGM